MKRHLLLWAAVVGLASLAAAAPSATAPSAEQAAAQVLVAQPNEKVILHALRGVVLLPDATPAALAKTPAPGLHLDGVPFLNNGTTRQALGIFLGRPVSIQSINRMETVIRIILETQGRPFARIYAPPQDITAGVVRVVVQLAVLQGNVRVTGNTWFTRDSYTAALHARAGEPLDSFALASDLAWINRNPFRHVTPEIAPGTKPGTTSVTLQARETFPLSASFGFDNTGTALTSDYRVSVSAQWGNAFGRGDLFNVGLDGDPNWKYFRSYSAGYTAYLPWKSILSLNAAVASLSSDLPEPFAQKGRTWNLGARYDILLRNPRPGWTQDLVITADFKYSDNTLLFSSMPITGNATDIVEAGADYSLSFMALGGQNSAMVSVEASPGGLAAHDHDRDFLGSRPGAKAEYGYGRLTVSHQQLLFDGFSFNLTATAQISSGALLGTEQLVGTGASAVRGYRESSAFGDEGVVVNNELHLPPLNLVRHQVSADFFAFYDAASLNVRVQDQNIDLRSVGLGANLVCFRRLSVRLAYGWQLKGLDGAGTTGWGHIATNLNW